MTIPGKLQSYLAAGKPIVTMLNGEGASVIIDSGAGVSCRAGDFQGLADSVSKLASMSAQELEVMGMKALEYTDREFNRAKLISKLELLLEQTKLTKLDKTIKV
jgi:glycosyltransferase involved in cell wall biosynthesis